MKLFIFFFILLLFPACLFAQTDTTSHSIDSVQNLNPFSGSRNIYQTVLDSNILVNSKAAPSSLKVTLKKDTAEPLFFYIMIVLLLILALMKTLYSRYFSTLFRVFFNTSLRQNQLTDQLEQAKFPSLIFNIFFVITGGIYVSMLLHYFVFGETVPDLKVTGLCIAGVGACYIVKFISLKFTGWVTGFRSEADVYIFIIFLLNKVIGVLLLPFIVVMIFSSRQIASFAVSVSLILLGLILLLRFFRSYSLLQNKLKVSRFHFFLYITAFEILPLAVIYRFAMVFLGINP